MPILDLNNKQEVEEYNNFVRNRRGTSFMQDINWAVVKGSDWKQECVYVKEDGKIIAAMMILFQKVPYMKATLGYAPRGPVCDVNDIELVNKLVKEAEPACKKHNAFALKFDPQVLYTKEMDEMYKKAGYKTSGENPDVDKVIQPLHDGVIHYNGRNEEELMKSFAEKTRYNIRLSGRKGVTVRYSRDIEDLKIFHELYKVTAIRDRIGCREIEYFERMLNSYDEKHLRIYIAEHEGQPLSAAIATNYGGELYYVYGASSNEKRNLMPNYKMQMEMIKWGIENECDTYNFGGILNLDPLNGLYKFKTGFCHDEGVEKYFGEINKVYNPTIYWMFDNLLPVLKNIQRKIRKMKKR